MFDGLIAVLMQWLGLAFCWIVKQLVLSGIALIQLVTSILPSVAVPEFLSSSGFAGQTMAFLAWLLPLGPLSWMLLAWMGYEIAHFLLLIVYRLLSDLL